MEAALQEPVPTCADAVQSASLTQFLFVCSSCEREHHSRDDSLPDGWTLQPSDRNHARRLRCPDCRVMSGTIPAEPQPERPFLLFLEKQETGEFQIAMQPENVMMRWLPLGFYLNPAQARTLAATLIQMAALAEKPGSVPNGKGGIES